MATPNPFTIEVYDKNFTFQCFIGDPINVVATPRHNQKSTASITVASNHRRLGPLTADGARCVLRYYGEFLMSGPLNLRTGQGPGVDGTVTLYLDGDFRILDNVLAWVSPTSLISSQGGSEYYIIGGNAESVLKDLVTKNAATRLGMPVVCANNQNRGAVIPGGIKARFQPLRDLLLPPVETAGLGITFSQSGSVIVCDVYVPQTFPRVLSEAGGMITDWKWSDSNPSATRVVVAGQGDGTARVFRAAADSSLETQYGDIIEVFRDARDADNNTLLDARGQESLADGRPKFGFALTLAETDSFRYGGKGVHVGDRVTVDLGFTTRTDILREATISWTAADGVGVTPLVGELQDNPDRALGNFLRSLRKGISDLKVSK
ncbi:MAG: Gp37-like protein [Arthrobacter sp.]